MLCSSPRQGPTYGLETGPVMARWFRAYGISPLPEAARQSSSSCPPGPPGARYRLRGIARDEAGPTLQQSIFVCRGCPAEAAHAAKRAERLPQACASWCDLQHSDTGAQALSKGGGGLEPMSQPGARRFKILGRGWG